ncbi:MAG: hypothetical protein M1812_006024 [Candelaria pacifica]|nr:MAG: hypothetical protein M1812_006024 [Candelaria pacifica]
MNGNIKIADFDGHVEVLMKEIEFVAQGLEDQDCLGRIFDDEKRFVDVERSVVTIGYVEDYVVEGRLVGGGLGSEEGLKRKVGFERGGVERGVAERGIVERGVVERGVVERGFVTKDVDTIIREGQVLREQRERLRNEKLVREKVISRLFTADDTTSGEELSSESQTSVEEDGEERSDDEAGDKTTGDHLIRDGIQRSAETEVDDEATMDHLIIRDCMQPGAGTEAEDEATVDHLITRSGIQRGPEAGVMFGPVNGRPLKIRPFSPFPPKKEGRVSIREPDLELDNTAIVRFPGHVSSSEESVEGDNGEWIISTARDGNLKKTDVRDGHKIAKSGSDIVDGWLRLN